MTVWKKQQPSSKKSMPSPTTSLSAVLPELIPFFETCKAQRLSVLITAHRDPDLDAIGSCLGLASFLTALGANPQIWLPDPLPSNAHFLPGVAAIQTEFPTSFSQCICLDSANLDRVRHSEKLPQPFLNIDHHQGNPHFAQLNWVDSEASSVGEMLSVLCRVLGETKGYTLPADGATALYAALVFDTGRFLFSNTKPSTFAQAAWLLDQGADFATVSSLFESLESVDFEIKRLSIANLVVDPEKRFAYTVVENLDPTAQIKPIDTIRAMGGVEVFAAFSTLQGHPEEINVSLRSKGEFDVNEVAAHFGGGGHRKAAGISLHRTLDAAISAVIGQLDARIPHP